MSENPFEDIAPNKVVDAKRKNPKLNDKQKEFILDNFDKMQLLELTQKVFNDSTLDGRSKEGIAVKRFLERNNKPVITTEYQKRKVKLSEENQEYILRHAHDMKPLQIARIIFADTSLHHLSAEAMAVQSYIKEHAPDILKNDDLYTDDEYKPPKSLGFTIKRINQITGENYEYEKMNVKYKKGIEQLMKYLRSPRFVATMNNFSSVGERALFEAEFIKTTWNKPDLTADEVNLYINVINEYVVQNRTMKILEKLNNALDKTTADDEEQIKISMGLSDAIKGKTEEYHKSVSRQESLVKQLEGERSKRISAHREQNRSIAALVELFKEEEERKNMIRIAEMRKKKLKEEIHKYENEDELIARVFGISEEELLD